MHQFLFRWVSVAECLIQGYKLIGDSLSVDVVAELLRYLLFEKTSLGESLCGEKKRPSMVRGFENPGCFLNPWNFGELIHPCQRCVANFCTGIFAPFALPTWNFQCWPWFKRGTLRALDTAFVVNGFFVTLTQMAFLECLRIVFQKRKKGCKLCQHLLKIKHPFGTSQFCRSKLWQS